MNVAFVFLRIYLAKSNGKRNAQQSNSSDADFDFDGRVLCSTPVRTANVENNRRRSDSCIVIDETSLSSTLPKSGDNDALTTAKTQRETGRIRRAPRTRKLRPEDERTLKILAEKFQSAQHGMVCQIPDCRSKPIQCSKPANLKRHLSQIHPKVYNTLFPNELSHKHQTELEAFNLAQDTIELVTVNGYPFSMLNASGMQGFIKPRLQSIRANGISLSINRHDIVS